MRIRLTPRGPINDINFIWKTYIFSPERFRYYRKSVLHLLKVIRKFFLKHNKSFRWHLGDYEKHNLFPFEGL